MKIRLRHKFDLSLVFLIQYFCPFLNRVYLQQHERFGSFIRSLVTRQAWNRQRNNRRPLIGDTRNNFVTEWRLPTG